MALSIKNAEAEALARRLAQRTGKSVTGAITAALRRQLDDLEAADEEAARAKLEKMRRISADAAARWPDGTDTDPSSWLYDERGLPA